MFVVISPAKKLLSFTKPFLGETSTPVFTKETGQLAQLMKQKTVSDLRQLMDLSEDLAVLNYERYQHFNLNEHPINQSYPALLLFQGDVYQGLQAKDWIDCDREYAQSHLGILSGLYGLLKPMDRIQAYRLEMGVRLANTRGETLYDFWRTLITRQLNEQLKATTNPLLINLASTEYFKAVDTKKLDYPVVTINFYEQKNNEIKMIGIYAKKARGLMAKFIVQQQCTSLEHIKEFNDAGYCFNPAQSSEHHLDFVRVH